MAFDLPTRSLGPIAISPRLVIEQKSSVLMLELTSESIALESLRPEAFAIRMFNVHGRLIKPARVGIEEVGLAGSTVYILNVKFQFPIEDVPARFEMEYSGKSLVISSVGDSWRYFDA